MQAPHIVTPVAAPAELPPSPRTSQMRGRLDLQTCTCVMCRVSSQGVIVKCFTTEVSCMAYAYT